VGVSIRSPACGGFHQYPGVEAPFWVARIQEDYPKSPPDKQQRLFYVLTARPGLVALELREVGHRRSSGGE